MAITTLQGVINGLIPSRPFGKTGLNSSSITPPRMGFTGAGFPTGGVLSSATNGATYDKNSAGALPFTNPASGNNTYLSGMKWPVTTDGRTITVIDLLWSKVIDISLTTAQTIDSVAFPARDINGATNGDGVHVALYFSSTNATGTADASISYTNSDGTAGRTGNMIWTVGSPQSGVTMPFSLEGGDTGVRSIQTFTLSAAYTGAAGVGLIAFRPIASIFGQNSKTGEAVGDAVSFAMPRVYDDSCLTFLYHNVSAGIILGTVEFTQG